MTKYKGLYKRTAYLRNRLRASSGYTLLELLISVVVLSLGLLGVGSLQAVSVRSNFEAFQRTDASQLANDIVDRIRANSTMLSIYASAADYTLGGGVIENKPPACAQSDSADTCQNKMANLDRWEWEQIIDSATSTSMVNGRICITQPDFAANPGIVQVVVAWRGIAKRGGDINVETTKALNPCGKTGTEEDDYLKQVVVNTYVTITNPY